MDGITPGLWRPRPLMLGWSNHDIPVIYWWYWWFRRCSHDVSHLFMKPQTGSIKLSRFVCHFNTIINYRHHLYNLFMDNQMKPHFDWIWRCLSNVPLNPLVNHHVPVRNRHVGDTLFSDRPISSHTIPYHSLMKKTIFWWLIICFFFILEVSWNGCRCTPKSSQIIHVQRFSMK